LRKNDEPRRGRLDPRTKKSAKTTHAGQKNNDQQRAKGKLAFPDDWLKLKPVFLFPPKGSRKNNFPELGAEAPGWQGRTTPEYSLYFKED
jgi:hypothetical protein